MDLAYLALAIAGGVVLAIGLLSELFSRTPLSEPLLAVVVGILVGPAVFGWFDPRLAGGTAALLREAALITLAIGLMGTALRIEHQDFRRIWRPSCLILLFGMLGMWVAGTLLAGLVLGLGLWPALLVAAAVTPTDPIVSSAILTGSVAERDIPRRLRGTLSLESGANDGLAVLFVSLALLFLTGRPDDFVWGWITHHLLTGVVLGAAFGIGLGYIAAALLSFAKARKLIEEHSLLSFTVALSLFTLGLARLIGTEPLVAVFACGLVFNIRTETSVQHEEENVQEAVNKLFSLPIFILFGAALPWTAWHASGWPLILFVFSLLALRRLPAILALHPLLRRDFMLSETAFLAWFGPVGIAALYYATDAWAKTGDATLWHVVSAVIMSSIIVHGMSAAPLTKALGRHLRSSRRSDRPLRSPTPD